MIEIGKDRKVMIMCAPRAHRGGLQNRKITTKELEAMQEKTPTRTIPCANGDHEDCSGEGCECECNHGHGNG